MPPRKTRTFNQWQSMQKAKSNGKGEKKFFFPACQLERARVLGFLAKHLAAMKGNKGSKGNGKLCLVVFIVEYVAVSMCSS